MGIEFEKYEVLDQMYLIPTLKITHNRGLNGYYAIDLVWIKWGISLMW